MDDLAQRALEDVLTDARDLGFLGPGAIAPHIAHARAFVDALPHAPRRFLDLGSGGGLPGLVIALDVPTASGVLLDSSKRRTDFLRASVEKLGLTPRLDVVCDRAETASREATLRGAFDLVTARSFAAPAVTAECAVGFLEAGGVLVVSEPPTSDPERWPEVGLARLGLTATGRAATDHGHFAIFEAVDVAALEWPRRVGIPAKRPLWG